MVKKVVQRDLDVPEMDNKWQIFTSYFSSQMLSTLVEREGELTLVPDWISIFVWENETIVDKSSVTSTADATSSSALSCFAYDVF